MMELMSHSVFLWPVAACAVLSLLISIERLYFLFLPASIASEPFMKAIEVHVLVGDLDRAIQHCLGEPQAPLANVVKEAVTGTPLEAWPVITRSQVEELKHFRVRTVEDLAALSDAATASGMGLQSLKQKAKAFLEAAAGNGGAKFQAAIEQKDAQIATLEKMVKDQSEKIEQLLKAKR